MSNAIKNSILTNLGESNDLVMPQSCCTSWCGKINVILLNWTTCSRYKLELNPIHPLFSIINHRPNINIYLRLCTLSSHRFNVQINRVFTHELVIYFRIIIHTKCWPLPSYITATTLPAVIDIDGHAKKIHQIKSI